MRKGKWKKRLLCAGLTMAMLVGMVMDVPSMTGQTIFAAGQEQAELLVTAKPGPESATYRMLTSHDYDAIKAALECDGDYYITLDGDMSKSVATVEHGPETDGELAAAIIGDIATLGLMEILWHSMDDFMWRPRDNGGALSYLFKLGKGYKVLDLNGHNFTVSNPEFASRRTMFQVNEGTDFTIKDDKDKGEVFYNGYIFAAEDYNYFKEKMGGDMQRDLIEVNGGKFTLNGGVLSGGRSKNESGFNFFNANIKNSSTADSYTGSATKYVNSTAIVLESGEVTINKGTIMGRGYEEIEEWHGSQSPHTKNGVIEAKSGIITFNDGYVKAKGGADCFQLEDGVEISVRSGKFSLHRNDALFCGRGKYSDSFYTIDVDQPFGCIGIPTNAIPAQTWVEYGTGYSNGTDMLNSSDWREEFQQDVEGHHGKDDYEPWVCIYPDGGWGTLTAVGNQGPEVPNLNPNVDGQLYFAYEMDSVFSYIPEEVRKTGGWKREYEFMLYDENGEQISFDVGSDKKVIKASYDLDDYNLGHTLEYNPAEYGVSNVKRFAAGKSFYVVCVMKETYHGERTYTATTMAGRHFVCKDLNAPKIMFGLPGHEQVEKKGDEITFTSGAYYATDLKWYKKTSAGDTPISSEEYTVYYQEYDDGTPFLMSTKLTTKVDQEATYYCVYSNTIGMAKTECKVTYPVSFVYTSDQEVKIFKKYGGEISQPIDGSLEPGMYFKWYYMFWEVNASSAFKANGNKLTIPANAVGVTTDTPLAFFCELRQKKGEEDVLVATSPVISVKYLDEDPPERKITGLIIDGLANKLYIGEKAPTAEQISIRNDAYGVDPRVRVKNVTFTEGVNEDGIIISPNPTVVMQFETTSNLFYFEGTKDYDHYGDQWIIFYMAGSYIWGYAPMVSDHTGYVNVSIRFDDSDGHYALQRVPDTLLPGFDTFDFVQGEYVDIPLNLSLEMSDYSLQLGEKHYISQIEKYPYFSNIMGFPSGLEVVQTGTRTNAYGRTEPVYHLRGTVTKNVTSKTQYTYLDVTISGFTGETTQKRQSIRMNYNVLPPKTATTEEVEETVKEEVEEKITRHFHEMEDWQPLLYKKAAYYTHHERYCKYFEEDYDANGVELYGGCWYVEREPHDFYDLEVIREATESEPGLKKSKCAVCGVVLEREYVLNPEGHTVTLDLNLGEGYGNQTKDIDAPDESFILPGLSFEHPDGKIFAGWEVDGVVKQPGESITVNADVTVKAVWKDATLNVTFMHNCSFGNNLSLYFAVPVSELEGYENIRLICTRKQADEKGDNFTDIVSDPISYSKAKINGVDQYLFEYANIAAKNMGDEISAVLYADKGSKTYRSKPDVYSVRAYAYSRLDDSTNAKFKTLVVDMLNYGAQAQAYFKYNTKHPVNAALTDVQKALATEQLPELTSVEDSKPTDGAVAQIEKKNVAFDNNIILLFAATFPNGYDCSKAQMEITYTAADGKEKSTVIKGNTLEKTTIGGVTMYVGKISTISVKDLGTVVTAKITQDGVVISNVQTYSVESYVKNRLTSSGDTNFKNLLTTLMKYGKAAEAYFKKN